MMKNIWTLIAVLLLGAGFFGWRRMAIGQETRKVPIPAPAVVENSTAHEETAVLAGGCLKGVTHTVAGYSGGAKETANYGDVSSERTEHAESLKIVFNPQVVSYGTILRIFFSVVHDPTQLNRQGPDVGTSYRSVIFYASPEQERVAKAYIAQLDAAKVFPKPIVTQVVPLKAFYDGESYHQDYADKNPNNPYIQICDVPKMAALKAQFPELFQEYHGH
jgi:peptide-methionine (S)-S-oxide reductase